MTSDWLEYAKKHLSLKETSNEEDMVVVLRAHLLAEIALDRCLVKHLFHGDVSLYEKMKLRFARKIELSRDLLAPDAIKALQEINDLRNSFAHDLEAKLENFDTACLLAAEKMIKAQIEKDNPGQLPPPFTKKELFGLCAFWLLGKIDQVTIGGQV